MYSCPAFLGGRCRSVDIMKAVQLGAIKGLALPTTFGFLVLADGWTNPKSSDERVGST